MNNNSLTEGVVFTPAVVCYLVRDGKVLLGLRKRVSWGMGENLIAGIGGKVGDKAEFSNETCLGALGREVIEEIGVKIGRVKEAGEVKFIFPHKPRWNQDVYVYVVETWDGEPTETEDIAPMWFDVLSLPRDRMWDDNAYWVPKVLAGGCVNATFLFDENNKVLEHILE
jgi:8-oxo-dGTP diphosphatase